MLGCEGMLASFNWPANASLARAPDDLPVVAFVPLLPPALIRGVEYARRWLRGRVGDMWDRTTRA